MDKLPGNFLKSMASLLGDDYPGFLDSYKDDFYKGLRINTLKVPAETFRKRYGELLKLGDDSSIPWCKTGVYYKDEEDSALSRSPLYSGGLFYIQEPSAMSPVEFMDIRPGMKVLDLCAAPGGKSVQIAAKLNHEGILVSNDISLKRTKAILKNIEIQGITNALVTNADPAELADFFGSYFDRILVDAPCSGEGMFRKDPSLIKAYEEVLDGIKNLQMDILTSSSQMLAAGGLLMYSTCTFNQKENEEVISEFLSNHPDFEAVNLWEEYPEAAAYGFQEDFMKLGGFRLFPHKLRGEGHFLCLLRKKSQSLTPALAPDPLGLSPIKYPSSQDQDIVEKASKKQRIKNNNRHSPKSSHKLPDMDSSDYFGALKDFERDHLKQSLELRKLTFNHSSFYSEVLDTTGAKFRIIRNGLYLGDVKNHSFSPSSALIMSMNLRDFKHSIRFKPDDINLEKFLKCETLTMDEPDGTYFVGVDDYPLGYVKIKNKTAKNFYNKNWRLL